MNRIKTIILSTVAVVTLSVLPAAAASAQVAVQGNPCSTNSGLFSFPTWYKYLDPSPPDCEPTISGLNDFWLIIAAVMEILLRLGSLLAVGFIIWGGFRILTSQGDPNTVKESRDTIINAVIGLVVTIIAAVAINFAAGRFN